MSRPRLVLIPLVLLAAAAAMAQEKVYRCGNEYTNNAKQAQARNCKLVEGGNVTIIQGTGVRTANAPARAGGERVDSADQRARDTDARAILESELQKAEARQAALLQEYKNGEPDKQGPEFRNHQMYLDRVTLLKSNIARNEADIAGIRRELGRLGVGGAPAAPAAPATPAR